MHLPQCAPHPQCSQAGSLCVQRPGIKFAGCQPGARANFQAASQFAYAPCTCDAFTSMQRISSRKDTAVRTFAKSRGNALNSSRVTSPTIVFALRACCVTNSTLFPAKAVHLDPGEAIASPRMLASLGTVSYTHLTLPTSNGV